MGLDQYAIKAKKLNNKQRERIISYLDSLGETGNIKDLPSIKLLNLIANHTKDDYAKELFDLFETDEFWYGRKISPLQYYFEEYHNIDNLGYVILSEDVLDDIQSKVDWIKDNLDVLYNMSSLYDDYSDEYIERFNKSLEEYKQMLEEKFNDLPLKPIRGFFYGNDKVNIHYFEDIRLIEEFIYCARVELETLMDDEMLTYSCWY